MQATQAMRLRHCYYDTQELSATATNRRIRNTRTITGTMFVSIVTKKSTTNPSKIVIEKTMHKSCKNHRTWSKHGAQIHKKTMKNQYKNQCGKKDAQKSTKINPQSAQWPKRRLQVVAPTAFPGQWGPYNEGKKDCGSYSCDPTRRWAVCPANFYLFNRI